MDNIPRGRFSETQCIRTNNLEVTVYSTLMKLCVDFDDCLRSFEVTKNQYLNEKSTFISDVKCAHLNVSFVHFDL